MIRVGPFDLIAPLARGGMGEVWRGVHRTQGVPVAVKVLMTDTARRAEYVEPFRAEVRAVAGLDHPGICTVLDHGLLDAGAERASEGRLVAGSPWLAMELCSGGTLAGIKVAGPTDASPPVVSGLDWVQLKLVLLAVLDALAHAHARGVVHRDLKPSNVLVATRGDSRPGLKLSDFGIAYAAEDTERSGIFEEKVLGTPMYMAPEQIRGEWRDYGPWTDLYALGGLTYRLVTGQPLFPRGSQRGMVAAHLREEPRPIEAPFPVPPGFVDWVLRLVAKPWQERFPRAADAAWALIRLGDVAPVLSVAPPSELETTLHALRDHLGETWRMVLEGGESDPGGGAVTVLDAAPPSGPAVEATRSRPARGPRPPLPERWMRQVAAPAPAPLVGAGLALFGLRATPIVGREKERDLLWQALRDVAADGRARAVIVHGPAGTGKSSLAAWLAERAHEVGAANVVRAMFGPTLIPAEALKRLGASYLHTYGLTRPDVEMRVEDFVRGNGGGDAEVKVLTELLCPATAADVNRGVQPVRLTRPSEYYAAVGDAIFRLAQDRPVVVWLDDVQWGLHGLGLVKKILEGQDQRAFPALLVLTARDEDLIERREEREKLDRIRQLPSAVDLALGPLPPEAQARLVRGLLRLDPALAGRVEARTAGNPLFALQLVGDWVQRGLLELGPTGFVLRQGASARLPDDLHHVWSSRLGAVLDEFPPDARRYLEIAAILGREVSWQEWKRACDDPGGLFGARFPGDDAIRAHLLERLRAERLAVGERASWAFVHGMLRESLERGAEESGAATAHHLACALMLEGRASEPDVAERIGRHLVAGGRPADAIDPLLIAVEVRLVTLGPGPASALMDDVHAAARACGLAPSDPRQGQILALEGRIAAQRGDTAAALGALDAALSAADRYGWEALRRRALSARAEVRETLGALDGARADFAELVALGGRSAGRGLVGLGRLRRKAGDPVEASRLLQEAAKRLAPGVDLADCAWEMAQLALAAGDPAAAARLEAALQLYERSGVGPGSARCLVALAGVRVRQGDPIGAESALRRAQDLLEALGSDDASEVVLRRAVTAADRGAWADVSARIDEARPRWSSLGHADRVALAVALEVLSAARRGDRGKVEACLRTLDASDAGTAGFDAWILRAAAGLAQSLEHPVLSRALFERTRRRWRALGRVDEMREAEWAGARSRGQGGTS